MSTITLQSGPMVSAPGILRWAINGFKFKKDRPAMRRVIQEGWKSPLLTRKVVDDLLSGTLPYKIEGENVVVEIPDA